MMDRLWAFCLIPYGVFRLCFSYEKNPLHGPELTGKKEYLISQRIPLEILKEIKKKAQVSMSTVLFSCLSYALTCHFKRRKANNISNIIVLIPVGLQDMSKPVTFKNSFALKGTLLPTSIQNEKRDNRNSSLPSSIIRLRQVDANLFKTKKDASFLAIHYLIISLGALLPECLTKVLLTTKGLTTSFSNVAGPQGEDLFYCGCKQEDIAFWVPDRSPMGMGVSVTGWNGNVLVGLMADTGLIPTVEEGYEFLKDFINEIENLYNDLNLTKSSVETCEKSNLLPV